MLERSRGGADANAHERALRADGRSPADAPPPTEPRRARRTCPAPARSARARAARAARARAATAERRPRERPKARHRARSAAGATSRAPSRAQASGTAGEAKRRASRSAPQRAARRAPRASAAGTVPQAGLRGRGATRRAAPCSRPAAPSWSPPPPRSSASSPRPGVSAGERLLKDVLSRLPLALSALRRSHAIAVRRRAGVRGAICILPRHAELPRLRSRQAGDPMRIGQSIRWGESARQGRSAVDMTARARQLTP